MKRISSAGSVMPFALLLLVLVGLVQGSTTATHPKVRNHENKNAAGPFHNKDTNAIVSSSQKLGQQLQLDVVVVTEGVHETLPQVVSRRLATKQPTKKPSPQPTFHVVGSFKPFGSVQPGGEAIQYGRKVALNGNGNILAIASAASDSVLVEVNRYNTTSSSWNLYGQRLNAGFGLDVQLSGNGQVLATSGSVYRLTSNDNINKNNNNNVWTPLGYVKLFQDDSVFSLSSDGKVVAFSEVDDTRAYKWDGIIWKLQGNPIPLVAKHVSLSANGTRIALTVGKSVKVFRLVPNRVASSTWVQVGKDIATRVSGGTALQAVLSGNGNRVCVAWQSSSPSSLGQGFPGSVHVYQLDTSTTSWKQVGSGATYLDNGETPIRLFFSQAGTIVAIAASKRSKIYQITRSGWNTVGQGLYYYGLGVAMSGYGTVLANAKPIEEAGKPGFGANVTTYNILLA